MIKLSKIKPDCKNINEVVNQYNKAVDTINQNLSTIGQENFNQGFLAELRTMKSDIEKIKKKLGVK